VHDSKDFSELFSAQEYALFCDFLSKACGIVLGTSKTYLVGSRLGKLMKSEEIQTLGELMDRLKSGSEVKLREKVIDAMTTNETNWFRDNHPYEVLRHTVLPEMRQKNNNQPLRVWSAACSSGQEPYTISMCFSEYLLANGGAFPSGLQIFATDISSSMIAQAQAAEYDIIAMARGLSAERQQMFFEEQPNKKMCVSARIKERVVFRQLNLLDSFVLLGKFHVIFCRNVLIYFSDTVKVDIISRLAAQIHPGGYLFLGASESIASDHEYFEMIKCDPGIVYKRRSCVDPSIVKS